MIAVAIIAVVVGLIAVAFIRLKEAVEALGADARPHPCLPPRVPA
jgi:hypothetical protein